ncbi:DUF3592 domain-containing protein [Massilia rubra]|uniref:DUF3592 domain-containing protein n=1 Tax=Massilia rubra TaxID=2607910 RepID=A0ABX0LQI3_9BURK|nr:DUF3592 domain-containing protein [Massilia rubra]NHZ36740.1 hypothetical protein [Massilia rubra]
MLPGLIPPNTSTRNLIWGVVFFFASICLFLFGYEGIQDRGEFIKSTVRADGVVVRQTAGKHHVDVRFTTAKGEVVEYGQNGDISYEAGEKVSVLYYADDPRNNPSTDASGALWGGSLTLFGVGVLTLFFSWMSIFKPEYSD